MGHLQRSVPVVAARSSVGQCSCVALWMGWAGQGAGRTFTLKEAWRLQGAAADAGGCGKKLWPKDIALRQ